MRIHVFFFLYICARLYGVSVPLVEYPYLGGGMVFLTEILTCAALSGSAQLYILLTSLQNNNKFNVTINQESLESQHQVTHFSDQSPQWDYTVDSSPDATFTQADSSEAELSNFFSRPIKVVSYSWQIGVPLFQAFDPWSLFFENTRVLNRIANYNLLRCKLKCRIVLNGNGFHYGRAIANYIPLFDLDDFTTARSGVISDVIAASQRPHVYLDPTNSQGGTLTLPFCWVQNALNIPGQDWRSMGEVFLQEITGLKHANGANDNVTISVFVWAEEVSLSIPTSREPASLAPQSGDEYSPGPISGMANSVMSVAKRLTDIPIIRPYAKATELAAGATASIAKLFGYSRPVNLETGIPYIPTPVGNLANANVKDTSVKLTLDLKQELCVDPRTMGLGGVDEMTITSISQRESFITTFGWQVSDPTETLLWNTEVNPVIWDTAGDELHLTACAFAALPFTFWRGTMKYRFQIVASAFHKGRLKIVYDPGFQASNEYNTNYTYIIDLAKERDFTVDVGWGNQTAFLRHSTPGVDSLIFGSAPITSLNDFFANGVLSVFVVNELTTPNSTVNNDVEINVFVSTGDDFQVVSPESHTISEYTFFDPDGVGAFASSQTTVSELTAEEFRDQRQNDLSVRRPVSHIEDPYLLLKDVLSTQSGEEAVSGKMNQPDADLTVNEVEPMKQMASEDMAVTINPSDGAYCVYFGDPVTSFRQCLKRYNFHSCVANTTNALSYFLHTSPDFPFYRGYAPGAVNLTNVPAASTPYNYCTTTLLNYLTPAFTARRGGIRWKYVKGVKTPDGPQLATLSRIGGLTPGYTLSSVTAASGSGNPNEIAAQCLNVYDHLWDGGVAQPDDINPVLEAEFPFYLPFRFASAKNADLTSSTADFGSFHSYRTLWSKAGTDQATVAKYCSIGEDFMLGFYTGPPIMYYAPSDPPAQG